MKETVAACLLTFASLLSCAAVVAAGQTIGDIDMDYAGLVSRADLHYNKPAGRSEEGMPVGNGRMGSLVWTTAEAIRLQINRVDVFANNSYSTSFPARNSDYCGGCGFVGIAFGGEVFTEGKMSQHLHCYDGLAEVRGDGIAANVLAWNEQDVIAFEISDSRQEPAAITVVLRMLRAPEVKTGAHRAVSKIESRDGRIILTQQFTEGDYYCGSAVAVGIVGRNAQVQTADEGEIRLAAGAGGGTFTVLIASAASFDPKEDLVASSLKQLAAAEKKGFAELAESNKAWWHDFWSKGYIDLHSEDGVADTIEQNYTYYLYVMASSSRGRFPTKFNGMIWTTGGDKRSWGGQYWGANQECLYNALLATNRMELLDPMFDMYSGMYESCATAARQQWGSQGIYIPETVAFDGLAKLPDDIAAEMRDLYLLRKPWDQRSEKFLAVARTGQPHSSRWNWMGGGSYVDSVWQPTERGGGPFGPVTHIFSRGAKIAYTYWQRYEYTLDEAWLRDRAYPMLKGVAEFYRNYPNLKKGADGKYHLHHVNSNESVQGGQDPDEEIASMMGILPAVIKASEILGVDAEMRPVWKELLDNLAPLPTGGDPLVWIRALPPVFRGRGDGRPDGNTMPQWFFDLCTLENDDPETMKVANATMDGYLRGPDTRPGVLSKVGVAAAMMGRADAVRYLLPNQLSFPDRAPVLANRLDQREGQQTTNAQRLGRVADTLHNALIQSVGAGPAREPVIRVFPAWPKEWDAEFCLPARGAFLVGSSMKAGKIEYVRIDSQAGGECRLCNPWPGSPVILRRDGNKAENLSGSLLVFPTRRGETVVVTASQPFDVSDDQVRISSGMLGRVIDLANGNVSTTHLRVNGQELLAGPAAEVSFTVTRAEPNGRPKGLEPGEGGSIDSVQTFRPGQHVDPGAYDDTKLGQTTRWVESIHLQADRWADSFALETPEVSTPKSDVSRLTLRARAQEGSPLNGLAVAVVYEVYAGEPVVRKWVEIANRSNVWRKIEELTIDDFALAPGLPERVLLTPAGYGAQPSLIGCSSADGTFGVIAANEIPSALRVMGENGSMGYHPAMFEWVLAPGEKFVSEPVFLYAFSGPVEQTLSARSTPLDRAVEGPFQRFVSRHIGIAGERLPCDAPQWLTWATFGPELNDAMIRQQADLGARAGFVQFLMDDGWQRDRLGTEPHTAKFPDFAATADYVRSRGLKLGLWLSCFRDPDSPDLKAWPEARSLPVVTRLGGIAMSFTTPWREFYAQDLARLHERYGAVYFKQDFSNVIYGDLAEGHPNRTRKESLLRGLRGLLDAQDRLRALAPDVMNEMTHEIYWDTPGAPCDIAALKHAARYHVSPNACRGIVPRPRPGQTPPAVDPQKLRSELLAACYQARQIFYSHRGLPLYCLEFYGAATEDHEGSLTPAVQDRQVVSWLMGAPLVFSGDLNTLSDEHLAHYRKRFSTVNRLHQSWDIYRHFQFSGVPAPTDEDWHWWGKLNENGCGAVVVVRGSGGDERRAINIPWTHADRRYAVTALFAERPLGAFTGRQLQSGELKLALPVYGQEILELTADR